MNKLTIPIVAVLVIVAGIGAFVVLPKAFLNKPFQETHNFPLASDRLQPQGQLSRASFFEVHMEPSKANNDMFEGLAEFVNLADRYDVKLTLLFTPQWAEMILADEAKLSLLNQWKQSGHEMGGHHHGPSTCPWDGYTNLDVNSQEFKNRQASVPCPSFVREKEKYSGNMADYLKLLNKLGAIKTITMSDEDKDWPEGALYAAGGRSLLGAISQPKVVSFNGHEVYKLTSAPLEPKKSAATGVLITIDELKNVYLSEKEGVFGIGAHEVSYKNNPDLYRQWFEFLKTQNSKSKTISEVIEESSSPIKY